MTLEELVAATSGKDFGEYDWPNILPADPDDKSWNYSEYSGTHSVYDRSQVEDVTPQRIARIDRLFVERGDYAETDMCCLVELTDGTWATCMAWCDTTGWDCQSGVAWKWARTREDAISQGLDRSAREKLGVSLPGETNGGES